MSEIKTDGEWLLCPDCNGEYMHQLSTNVIFRDSEDGPGTSAVVSSTGTNISRIIDADIPGRRDVIEVSFSCELCPEGTRPVKTLRIMQHKGQTQVVWL